MLIVEPLLVARPVAGVVEPAHEAPVDGLEVMLDRLAVWPNEVRGEDQAKEAEVRRSAQVEAKLKTMRERNIPGSWA